DGLHLTHAVAPHLPDEFNALVHGLTVGPTAGSCGTACYRRERVIVADIATDPLWAPYVDIARRFELAACWSEPIFATSGRVLGAFAMYYRTARSPSDRELTVIETAAKLAAIALAREEAAVALRSSEEQLRMALAAAHMGTWDWNL